MYDFNTWRELYNTLTLEEQIAYHNEIEKEFPDQAHYKYPPIEQVIKQSRHRKVLEFGAWKGDLAAKALQHFPHIEQWVAVEICTDAMAATVCSDKRFEYVLPTRFDWFAEKNTHSADLIIATHFIEHLSNQHFEQLAQYCKGTRNVYFESPLQPDGQTWEDDPSTHKLEYGWNQVRRLMKKQGFALVKEYKDGMWFRGVH